MKIKKVVLVNVRPVNRSANEFVEEEGQNSDSKIYRSISGEFPVLKFSFKVFYSHLLIIEIYNSSGILVLLLIIQLSP